MDSHSAHDPQSHEFSVLDTELSIIVSITYTMKAPSEVPFKTKKRTALPVLRYNFKK